LYCRSERQAFRAFLLLWRFLLAHKSAAWLVWASCIHAILVYAPMGENYGCKKAGLQRMVKVLYKQKTRVLQRRDTGHWTYLDCLKHVLGAESRNRTGTLSPARDFESRASTYSAISATHPAIMADLPHRSNSYVLTGMVMPFSTRVSLLAWAIWRLLPRRDFPYHEAAFKQDNQFTRLLHN
jgi:hypothetical protein